MGDETERCARCFDRPGERATGGPPLCDWCRVAVDAENARIAEFDERRREQMRNLGRKKRKVRPGTVYCGLTVEEMKHLHRQQEGRCPICTDKVPLFATGGMQVDHCHRTGVVRGLLCQRCNNWLGRIDDDAEWVERMAAYLRRGEQLARDGAEYYVTPDRKPRE